MKIFYTIIITLIVVLLAIFILFELGYITTPKPTTPESIQELTGSAEKNMNISEKKENTLNLPQEINELMAQKIKEGTGEQNVKAGDEITVHYTGMLTDGKVFDSSVSRGTPFQLTIGVGQVIPGWDQGILGMQVGEIRRLLIPAELAYGANGVPGVIPPNSPLIFDVELISIDEVAETPDEPIEPQTDSENSDSLDNPQDNE